MQPPSRAGHYESPYTAVLVVDGDYYLIVDRRRDGFVARRLSKAEAVVVRRAFDDVHADLEARLVGRAVRSR